MRGHDYDVSERSNKVGSKFAKQRLKHAKDKAALQLEAKNYPSGSRKTILLHRLNLESLHEQVLSP